jgi:hypothetical protein
MEEEPLVRVTWDLPVAALQVMRLIDLGVLGTLSIEPLRPNQPSARLPRILPFEVSK